jgi:predicted nucleotidyltransferase
MTKKDVQNRLSQLKEEIYVKYKARIKGFFGSFSREEQTENSDLDVLVEFVEQASLFNLSGLKIFLEENFHCKVDVVSQNAIRTEIAENIHKDLVAV